MDKYVAYEHGQFVLSLNDPSEVGLSQRVFDFMVELMHSQNEFIQTQELFEASPKVLMHVNTKFPLITTRSGTENGGGNSGGINQWITEFTWHGYYHYIWISYNTLIHAAVLAEGAAIIAASAPDPTAATKVVAAICGLTGIGAGAYAAMYPNGIIISTYSTYLVPTVCIPYNISGQ